MTYDDALKELKDNYDFAVQQKWVENPLAWALYQTWKKVDNEHR